ncbi:MAG: Flp family type IVb pilin [Phycisphaerae bacterium]|nr:Flp family type IVb pilin [Phycisphaerae bacterium]
MISKIQQLVSDDSGTETLEYALVLGLIVVAAMALVAQFGTKVFARWSSVNSSFH